MVVQNFHKEKSIYEIQFCIRYIFAITKLQSRQTGKPVCGLSNCYVDARTGALGGKIK